jgi:hypothetical protein
MPEAEDNQLLRGFIKLQSAAAEEIMQTVCFIRAHKPTALGPKTIPSIWR